MSTVNFNIDSQIVVQTAAQWAADTTVYSNKRMLVTSDVFYTGLDQPRFKFANGVDTWANLDYVPEAAAGGTNSVVISYFNAGGTSLIDASSYYFGQTINTGATINAFAYIPIPAGTVTSVLVQTYNGSTFGTSEGSTLSLVSDAESTVQTDVIATDVLFDARHSFQAYTGLSISVLEGGSYFKLDTPTFVTNPVSAQMRITLTIEL